MPSTHQVAAMPGLDFDNLVDILLAHLQLLFGLLGLCWPGFAGARFRLAGAGFGLPLLCPWHAVREGVCPPSTQPSFYFKSSKVRMI